MRERVSRTWREDLANLVCGAAGTNFFAALLHDAQGRLSRVSERRARLAIAMANSGSSSNQAAEALDKALEQRQKTLEMLCKLLEGLQKAHEELRNNACKGAAPQLNTQG